MAAMITTRWVVDASPLICLGKIGHLDWLSATATEVVIPSAVAREIAGGPPGDAAFRWLESAGLAFVREAAVIDDVIAAWDLGRGESEVLGWARNNPDFTTVLDDRAARRCADVMGVPVCGTLGILIRARRAGLVPYLAPVLDEVAKVGLYLSPKLRAEALRLAGE